MTKNKSPTSKGGRLLAIATIMLALFRGRLDYVGVARGTGFCPEKLDEPLTALRLADEHLAGARAHGCYLLTRANAVLMTCLDFDNKPHRPDPAWRSKCEKVCQELAELGLNPLVEISQSGEAVHVWLFFSEPVPAYLVRQFWRGLLNKTGIAVPEIYPRQDELDGKQLGNLIRYPLWNKSRFVDTTQEWATIPPLKAMRAVKKLTEDDLQRVAAQLGVSLEKNKVKQNSKSEKTSRRDAAGGGVPPSVARLLLDQTSYLALRWNGDRDGLADNSTSALVASIACQLVLRHVNRADIEQTIQAWCKQHGYTKGKRSEWIDGVIDSAFQFVAKKTAARDEALKKLPLVFQHEFQQAAQRRAAFIKSKQKGN